MIELTSYLHHQHEFQYILPGRFMSDPIEARFGWYRQASGGNFFMSVKQLMLTEKKIRILSLLQQNVLLQASRFSADCLPLDVEAINTSAELIIFDEFLEQQLDNLDQLSSTDANVAYFVSGYIGRSISRRRKCSECKQLLLADKENEIRVEDHLPEECQKLFNDADRGGLAAPSEFCFATTTLAVQSYSAVNSNDEMKKRLLTCENPRSLFVTSLSQSVKSRPLLAPLSLQKCANNHNNFELIIQCAFNCFSKNELKRINSRKNEPPAKMSRTVRKLTSKSTQRNSSS